MTASQRYVFPIALLALLGANMLIFRNHYFFGSAIPWDFLNTYHALPYYWINAVQSGVSPEWIDVQGSGYPLWLNLQSGYFYPPFWIFVLLDIEYTIHAALLFQGLHVLAGSIGALILARATGLPWAASLFLAVCYQTFGGFYSNASHPDIVRYYAIVPWLFIALCCHAGWRYRWLALAITPIIFYLLITGSYPGGVIATFIVIPLLVVLRVYLDRTSLPTMIFYLAAAAIGTLLAAGLWLPLILSSEEILRAYGVGLRTYLQLPHLVTMVGTGSALQLPGDVTMWSYYIGIPAFVLAAIGLITNEIKKNIFWLCTATIGLIFASGLLHALLETISPFLVASRFPIADFRPFVALPVLWLAAAAFSNYPISINQKLLTTAFLALLFTALGIILLFDLGPITIKFPIAFIVFCAAAFFFLTKKYQGKGRAYILASVATVLLGSSFHTNSGTFNLKEGQLFFNNNISAAVDRQKSIAISPQTNECRPARDTTKGATFTDFSWQGYYNGKYMAFDYGGAMNLTRFHRIKQMEHEFTILTGPWSVHRATVDQGSMSGIPIAAAYALSPIDSSFISCFKANQEKRLRVNLDVATIVAEAEMYYPGWTARLYGASGTYMESLVARDINGLRGWQLPEGSYEVIFSYSRPFKSLSTATQIFGVFLYLLFLMTLAILSKRSKNRT